MPGKKSIGDLHATVTASAVQFVDEFKRADTTSAQVSKSIEKNIDDLGMKLKRKFTGADIGKEFLTGIGIGSGFQVAEKAAEMVVDYWKEAAEAAKKVEESTARQLELVKAGIKARQTDDSQRLAALQVEQKHLSEDLERNTHPTGFQGRNRRVIALPQTNEQKEEAARLVVELQRVGNEIDEIQRKITEGKVDTALTDFFGDLDDLSKANAQVDKMNDELPELTKNKRDYVSIKDITPEDEARAAAELKKYNDELDRAAERYKRIADPMREFEQQLDEINRLVKLGKLSPEEATGAALHGFFDDLDAKSQGIEKLDAQTRGLRDAAKDLGFSFASAFEDAVVDGEKFSDVVDGLIKDIIRLALRLAVINPILNGVFGSSGLIPVTGWTSLAHFAGGGDPPVGVPSLVGEEGAELFVPKTAGTIIPAAATRGLLNGGGDVYQIDARGADSGGMARLEAMIRQLNGSIEKRAISATIRAKRRHGSDGRALAAAY